MTLFKITGTGPALRLRLEHPIHLDENKEYFLGLTGFYGRNYCPNVPEPIQVNFHKYDPETGEDDDNQTLYISRGNYNVKNLENLFLNFIKSNYENLAGSASDKDLYYLRMNETIGKIEMKMPADVDLSILDYMLGFSRSKPYKSAYYMNNTYYAAVSYPRLDPFKTIEIHCNLVRPAITNHNTNSNSHEEVDILHTFCPKKEQISFGSLITEQPNKINYIPINKSVRSINKIELELKNESGVDLDFSGADIIVYLKLIEK